MAGNIGRPENASRNLASIDWGKYPRTRTPSESRRFLLRGTRAEPNSQDDAHGQKDTNPLPLTLYNNPKITRGIKREESEEEDEFCKACRYEQGCEESSEKNSGQEFEQRPEQDIGEYVQSFKEDYEEASEQGAGEYAQGYGEDYQEDCEEASEEESEEYAQGYEEDYEEASDEETGEYAQGYEEDYEEASEEETGEYAQGYEEDDEVANVTSSRKQLKHKAPSGRGKMGKGVDVENQKHITLRCSHCQGPHRKSNCPELPCSHCKEEGHVSLLCAKRLAKIRKNKNTEMWNRRKREAEGPAPVASGDTSQQSEKTNAENPRKRKFRRTPTTPTGSDDESASNDDGDQSSPEADQDSVDDGPQDSSASAEKTQEQEKTTRPMRCGNCKGPHRKRVCPHLPCAYCKEEGHTSCACPKRLLKQQKTKTANMRMWRKRETRDKSKTGGDDSKGALDGSSDHDKPTPPRLRCSVCRGPHRKPACPERPCTYCGERGHVRHDCPKRLADREERNASRKRQKSPTKD